MVMTLQMTLILYQQPFLMRRPPVLRDYLIELDGGFDSLYQFLLGDGTLTVLDENKSAQALSWEQDLSSLKYGDRRDLTATSTSGLEVLYKVILGQDVVRINNGILEVVGVGQVLLRAMQPGDEEFNPAPYIENSFNVAAGPQSIQWNQQLPTLSYGNVVDLEATSSSGLPVSFRVTQGRAEIDGNQLTLTMAGALSIEAFQMGQGVYAPADPVSRTFTVSKSPLTIRPGDVVRDAFQPNPDPLPIYYDGWRLDDASKSLEEIFHFDNLPVAETTAQIFSHQVTTVFM